MSGDLWRYRARPGRVIDGDTLEVTLDIGFHMSYVVRVRLDGIDTPEIRGVERQQGLLAKDYTQRWCNAARSAAVDWPLIVCTGKGRTFGRWVGSPEYSSAVLAFHGMQPDDPHATLIGGLQAWARSMTPAVEL